MMSPFPPDENGGVAGAAWDAYTMLSGEAATMTARGAIKAMAF